MKEFVKFANMENTLSLMQAIFLEVKTYGDQKNFSEFIYKQDSNEINYIGRKLYLQNWENNILLVFNKLNAN